MTWTDIADSIFNLAFFVKDQTLISLCNIACIIALDSLWIDVISLCIINLVLWIAIWCIDIFWTWQGTVSKAACSSVGTPSFFSSDSCCFKEALEYIIRSHACFMEINIIIPNRMSTTQDMRVRSC